jgi:hypothetical protein
MFRRRRLPADLEPVRAGFDAVLGEVEPAKAALAECMPTTRLPGRPLPDALADFESHLARARALMPGWRDARLEDEWRACEAALDGASSRARRLREDAPELGGFEALLGTVEGLIDTLDPFAAAAERFRSLRSSPGRERAG